MELKEKFSEIESLNSCPMASDEKSMVNPENLHINDVQSHELENVIQNSNTVDSPQFEA